LQWWEGGGRDALETASVFIIYYKRRGREKILFGVIIYVNYCLKEEASEGTCDFCAPASGK